MTTLLTMKGFNKQIDYLCFTANAANSSVKLVKNNSPTAVTLETSTDGINWSTYTFGTTITLSNVGYKIYWRNTSEITTGFSKSTSHYYQFITTGSIAASGDINYLLNKNSTTTLVSDYCYNNLFYGCKLTTAPKLTATTLTIYCYYQMFTDINSLETLPELPATTLMAHCYEFMFGYCTKIKLSTTQTGEYQTEYRIPKIGTGTGAVSELDNMFYNTGGTFTGTPSINTTYYTSNTLV